MLDRLRTFVLSADLGSVSSAAKKLYLTQSAVSQQIKQLEIFYKEKLLIRNGNTMILTPAGQRVYHAAKELLAKSKEVESILTNSNETQSVLTFSTVDSPIDSIIPGAVRNFLTKHKNTVIKPSILGTEAALQQLCEKKIDLAVCTVDRIPPTNISIENLFEEPLILVGPQRLANTHSVKLLQNESFLLFPSHSRTRHAIDFALKRIKIVPHVILETIKVAAIIAFIEAGLGISVVPYYSVKAAIQAKRIFPIPIKIKAKRHIGVAYLKNHPLSFETLCFIKYLKAESKRVK